MAPWLELLASLAVGAPRAGRGTGVRLRWTDPSELPRCLGTEASKARPSPAWPRLARSPAGREVASELARPRVDLLASKLVLLRCLVR